MATPEQKNAEPIKQDTTLKNSAEVSKENQKIDEEVLNSETKLASDVVSHNSKTEQEVLAKNIQTNSPVENQGTTKGNTLENSAKTQNVSETLGNATQTGGQTLEQGANADNPALNLYNQEMKKLEDIKNYIELQTMARIWITKCNGLLDGLKGNRKSKNELEEKIKRAIKTDLTPMTEDKHIYETGLNHYKDRLGKIIFDYYTNREPARQIIMMGGRVPVINGTADTKREAKRDARYAKSNAEYQIDMSEIKKTTALYTLIGVNANEWGDYCDFIGQGGIVEGHPVYIQHTAGFNQIRQYNPDLYKAITPKGQITYNTYCQRNPQMYQAYCRNNNIVCRPESFATKAGKGFTEMISNIFPGIESDPRKKEARTKAGGILAIGGAAIMGFKFFKNLFSSKKENEHKWRKAAGRGAGLLALLNIGSVEKWIEDAFNFHPAEKSRMLAESFKTYGFSDERAIDAANRYIGAPYTTMTALHFIPIYELESQKILEDKNGEIEFNYHNYETYVNKFRRNKEQKEQVLKAGKQLDEQKAVGAGLRAFGITTLADLKGLSSSDKNKTLAQVDGVKTGRGKMVERVQHGVNEKLYNNGFRAKDTDAIDKIMQDYDKNSGSTNMNTFIKSWMDQGLLEFNGNLVCSMDELKADINMDNMTLNGFKNDQGQDINFNTYGELFEAANLAKYIKEKFKGAQAKSKNPFHIDVTGHIKFDDTDRYELTKHDTNAVKYLTLKKNSILFENKKFFVNYLNMQWLLSLNT